MERKLLLGAAITIGLLIALSIADASAADTLRDPADRREQPKGPPPEAYTACEGKEAGETVTLKTPHGDVIEAVCLSVHDRLLAKPMNEPPLQPGTEK